MATGVQVQGWVGSERYPQGQACAPNSLLYVVCVAIAVDSTPKGYPSQPVTLGEHIRKTRQDRGLYHRHVAEAVGVGVCTINNWEGGHGEPEIRFIPAIIKFLGYNPRPEPEGTLERLEWYRWSHGLSIERLGAVMKRDPEQLSDWLSGRHKPFKTSLARIDEFLNRKN